MKKSSIYHRTGNYAKRVLASIVHFFKVRWTAKRFNIWTEELDKTCKEYYWLGYDNKIYYGHPMGILFLSSQNRWWLNNRR